MLKIEQQLTEKDYAYFVDFSIFERKPFNKIFLLYVAPVLGVSLLIFFFAMGEESNVIFIVLCALLIVLGWSMKFLFKRMSISNYRKNPVLGLKNIIEFLEEEIKMTSKQGVSRNKYTNVDKVYVTENYVVTYFKNQQFLGINTTNYSQEKRQAIITTLKEKCLGKLENKTK